MNGKILVRGYSILNPAHHPPGVHAVLQKLLDKASAGSGHHHLAGNPHLKMHWISAKVAHQSLHAANHSQ